MFSRRVLLGLTNGVVTAARAFMRDVCGQQHVAVGFTYLGGKNKAGYLVGGARVFLSGRLRFV